MLNFKIEMEKFVERVDTGWDTTKETRAELNKFQKEIMKENESEIEAIKNAIASLESFESFPIKIKYPTSSIDQKKFPQTLDIRPKPYLNEWKNERKNDKWETVSPDPLMICLDNRKFTVTPDIWTISKININQWNISLDVSKFWVKLTSQVYDPERMTKLLIILWTHSSWLNTDITWTPWAMVKEVK